MTAQARLPHDASIRVQGHRGVPASTADQRRQLAAVVGALLVGIGSVLVASSPPTTPPSRYTSASTLALVIGATAGVALLGAGAAAMMVRPGSPMGLLTMALGTTWFAADWAGWPNGPVLARSFAELVVPMSAPLLLHLASVAPTTATPSRGTTRLLVGAYVGTAAAVACRSMFRDPFHDPECWTNCTDNVFLVADRPGWARLFEVPLHVVVGAIGLTTVTVALGRLQRSTPVARRSAWAALVPTAIAGAGMATFAFSLLVAGPEDPERTWFAILYSARSATLVLVAVGVWWTAAHQRAIRLRLRNLANELADERRPGTFEAVLARSLGDPHLRVAYWLPTAARYVDGEGSPTAIEPRPDQRATTITRGAERLAVVLHDRDDDCDIAREFGPGERLAIENDRLRAEILDQLHELRASRARVVSTADATRRQLERNLHDGAQQRLLAAMFELRLAAAGATAAGDAVATASIDEKVRRAACTLDALRELANGIHPAILTEAGLDAAVRSLVERTPCVTDLRSTTRARYAAPVEAAAYAVVVAALDSATRNGTPEAVVSLRDDGGLLVEAGHDGCTIGPEVLVRLEDRVGAVGGDLVERPDLLEARFPCAS